MTYHNSDYHAQHSSDPVVGLGGSYRGHEWGPFHVPSSALGCYLSYIEGSSSLGNYAEVGSLNLPDTILKYFLILNEGCIT